MDQERINDFLDRCEHQRRVNEYAKQIKRDCFLMGQALMIAGAEMGQRLQPAGITPDREYNFKRNWMGWL